MSHSTIQYCCIQNHQALNYSWFYQRVLFTIVIFTTQLPATGSYIVCALPALSRMIYLLKSITAISGLNISNTVNYIWYIQIDIYMSGIIRIFHQQNKGFFDWAPLYMKVKICLEDCLHCWEMVKITDL